jgi:iron complex transport system ATP-binding protein
MNVIHPAERLPPETLGCECLTIDHCEDATPPACAAAPLLHLQRAATHLPGRCIGPFDLSLQPGARIAVLGPSGAGKSTLVKLMAGERKAHEGVVRLGGLDVARVRARDLARRRAVLPQQHAVAFGMPVELVVSLGRLAREPDPQQMSIVAAALEAACATHLLGRRFDTLSGGEQARVQLARVMAQLWDARQGLVLVDEPLAALDPGLQFELLDALIRYADERAHALVAVLHDVNQALSHFDRLWLVNDGRLVANIASDRAAVPHLGALFGIEFECVGRHDGRFAALACPRAAPLREAAA